MNPHLQEILSVIKKEPQLTNDLREAIEKALKAIDKELEITRFKLDRTEKVKKTTTVLLEETIEELEQKRKSVEEQKRILEIESALERVRGRTMAMQRSDELPQAANLLFQQVKSLEIPTWSAGYCIWDEDRRGITLWMSSEDVIQPSFHAPLTEDPVFIRMREAFERGESFYVEEMGGDELVAHYRYMSTLPGIKEMFELFSEAGVQLPTFQIFHVAFFKQGFLLFITYEPVPDVHPVFRRFASVFEQTYTRFLDLQKAEAQAWEAKVEASLERVRSKAMSMHSSQDLSDTIRVFYNELELLSITPRRCGVGLMNRESRIVELSTMNTLEGGRSVEVVGKLKLQNHPVLEGIYDNWLLNKEYHPVLRGNEIKEYYKLLKPQIEFPDNSIDEVQYGYFFYFPEGGVYAWTPRQLREDELKIYRRYTSVLSLTYKRYQDIIQAESQARESQIEVALERVRSKAMAMQKSDDLSQVVTSLFEELDKLKLGTLRCGVGIINREKRTTDSWGATVTENGVSLTVSGNESMDIHPLLQQAYVSWELQEDMDYLLEGEDLAKYYEAVATTSYKLPESQSILSNTKGIQQYYFLATFSSGGLYAFRDTPFPPEGKAVIKRFANVFGQTYTRFLDLQKAEQQAREAQIELGLERVRAKVMSMNQSSDLKETSLVFGEQLKKLGNDWIFSYFWLIEEENNTNTFWITWPDGNTSVTTYPLSEADDYTKECLDAWKKGQKLHSNHVPREQLNNFFTAFQQIVQDSGGVAVELMKTSTFPSGIYYYDAMMKYGSFGVCMNREATEEEKKIQGRFAIEFERAYTRFLDLQQAEQLAAQAATDLIKLKEEKKRTEKALNDLKAAQSQLIQSEKMASLGELTAGIAHEIQNPLNFVNNFSELNAELIDELNTEMEKGNIEDARVIAQSILENEQKINHHGKRADAIVKGMLMHSRSSSGQKELTNINALADEYFRLSYHGLRARDKSFNALMKTEFDEQVGEMNVIPGELGRVILNLITNAFYAVAEKNRNQKKGFEPTVTVSTRKYNDHVEIRVKDNGDGIPENVLDKIFQPFFTTKPTGQGTGLGLSMSYDIITKAHGGKLEAETKNGEGAAFIIQLPLEKTPA
jgi:signal transduction histidine kinase